MIRWESIIQSVIKPATVLKKIVIKPVKSEKYLERKKILKKSYEGRINTILHNYKMSKEVFHCFCLSVFRSIHS